MPLNSPNSFTSPRKKKKQTKMFGAFESIVAILGTVLGLTLFGAEWVTWLETLFVVIVVCVVLSSKKSIPSSSPKMAAASSSSSSFSSFSVRPNSMKKKPVANPTIRTRTRESLRNKVMTEFRDTERSFVNKLSVVRSVFLEPLSRILKPDQLRAIFSDIAIIEETNRRVVLEALEKWDASRTGVTPGDVFSELSGNASFLAAYKEFINNFDHSADTVKKLLESDKRFRSFVEKARSDPRCEGLNLSSLMIMPVQRVPRYILLLKELMKHTPDGSPDHRKLAGALDKLSKIAAEINESKSDAQSREMVVTLNSQLIGMSAPLMSEPSRRFVREALFVFVEDGGAPVEAWFHRRHLIAFNDLLVVAKAKADRAGRRQVVEELAMNELRIASTTSSGTNTRVMVVSCPPKKSVLAFASTSNADTDSWIELLKGCVEASRRKSLSFASRH